MSRYSVPRIYYNRKNRKEWQTSNCLTCSQEFTWKENVSRGKFCCKECETTYNREQVKQKILSGKASKRPIKKYLIETKGNLCETCKIDSWNNQPITLQIDHIDGNTKNNTLENFRLLCPNCHSQTPTWGRKKTPA